VNVRGARQIPILSSRGPCAIVRDVGNGADAKTVLGDALNYTTGRIRTGVNDYGCGRGRHVSPRTRITISKNGPRPSNYETNGGVVVDRIIVMSRRHVLRRRSCPTTFPGFGRIKRGAFDRFATLHSPIPFYVFVDSNGTVYVPGLSKQNMKMVKNGPYKIDNRELRTMTRMRFCIGIGITILLITEKN